MPYPIPEINAKYFCIINRNMPIMAAIISSYVYEDGKYTALLEYPDVAVSNASEFNIRAKNALGMMGGCAYLI